MSARAKTTIIETIGLGIAWRLAGRAAVMVCDRGNAGAGASHAAAVMLAACCEAEPGGGSAGRARPR